MSDAPDFSITNTAAPPRAASTPPAPPQTTAVAQSRLPPQGGPLIQSSLLRRPRGVVKINGVTASFLSFRVNNKTHFSADTWTLELEAWAQPQGFGLQFFSTSSNTQVEILMGFLGYQQDVSEIPTNLTSLIIGQVDDIDLELNDGKLVLSGRDFAAKLIDTKTANKWPDHTSSQIVTDLCNQVGLTPNVTVTTIPAVEYYRSYSTVTHEAPMWDLITFLAEQEGFDAYVTGQTLYFGPPQAVSDSSPFQIKMQREPTGIWSSVKTLHLRRSETIAKDISVTVLSHSYATGRGVKAVATRAGSGAGASSSSRAAETSQSYVERRANISQEQAQQVANNLLLELTKFEKTVDFSAEGDVTMNTRRKVTLSGTATAFDGPYFVNHLDHIYEHRGGGYEMSAALKNHPTLSQASTI